MAERVDARLSVVIVNFNSDGMLMQCVRSVLESPLPIELIVVDNGSGDGSVHQLRQGVADARLRIIENFANLGFARAANIGMEAAQGDYLLLLNPDCVVPAGTLEHMVAVMEHHPEVGMAGCLIRNPDGSEQPGCRRMVPTPARCLVRMLHLDRLFPIFREKSLLLHTMPLPDSPVEVDAISGAFMLIRREAVKDVGWLDELYFLHCEDLDWCMRFRAKGWKVLFVPNVEIVHHKGMCSRQLPVRVEWYKHKGMMRFYRKFFRHQYPIWMLWLIDVGVLLRFGLLAIVLWVRKGIA